MCFIVMMLKSNENSDLVMQKIYQTSIPIFVVKELALIEKRDWILFRDSPYHMFGRFIYNHLERYSSLKGYINKTNYNFEFIYEYLTDNATLDRILCYHHDKLITVEDYDILAFNQPYDEHWLIIDPKSNHTLIFFEYHHVIT